MEEIRVVVNDIGAIIAIGIAYNWSTVLKCASSLASAAREVVRAGVIVLSLTS